MTEKTKIHDKESVRAYLLSASAQELWRPMFRLWLRQTDDEQSSGDTKYLNSVGYNGRDAGFAASLIRQWRWNGHWSDKQVAAARRMLKKYAGQLADIANGNDGPSPSDDELLRAVQVPDNCSDNTRGKVYQRNQQRRLAAKGRRRAHG